MISHNIFNSSPFVASIARSRDSLNAIVAAQYSSLYATRDLSRTKEQRIANPQTRTRQT